MNDPVTPRDAIGIADNEFPPGASVTRPYEDAGKSAIDGASNISPPALPTPAPSTGRYHLLDEIARGGMGAVYRAADTLLGREVAVKVLLDRYGPESGVARRFIDEARIAGQLQHPGVPAVHDLGTLPDGRPFLAMKLIKGCTLEERLRDRADTARDRGQLLAVFEQVCQAVAYAHAHDVIHRDLKPSNVMVGAFGEVQVMDWGLAKALAHGVRTDAEATDHGETAAETSIGAVRVLDDATRAGSVLGTPAYMPPEQAIGAIDQVDKRSDVFGLGAVLCVILTGKPPYTGMDFEAIRQLAARGKLDETWARLNGCGAEPELVELCKRCLAGEKEDRPADAGEVARAVAGLRAAADERARLAELDRVRIEGERAQAETEAREQRRRRRVAISFGAVIAVLLVAAAVWQLWLTEQKKQRAGRATGEASAAVALAGEQWRKARQAAAEDLLPWVEALGAAEKARLAAEQPDVEASVRADGLRQFQQIKEAKEQAEARARQIALDRRIAGEVEELPARVQRFHNSNAWDYERVTEAFQEVFLNGYGIDIDRPEDAARRINASAIRKELLVGLEWWLPLRPTPADGRALADLIQLVDPNPSRREWRLALARNDRHQIRLLAWKDLDRLTPSDRISLARTLALGILFEDVVGVLAPLHPERPNDFTINLLLAMAYHRMEPADYAAAERHGWMAVAVRPDDPGGWTHLHATLLLQKQYVRANDVLLTALANTKDDTLVSDLARLHQTLTAVGQADLAFASAEKAVALLPDHASTHYCLALMWLVRKEPDRAYAITRSFLDHHPEELAARMRHGSICWRTDRVQEGNELLAAALAQDPDEFLRHYHSMRLTLRADELIRLCDDYLTRHPPCLSVLTIKGWCCELGQHWDRAEQVYHLAVELAPRDKLARQRLCRTLTSAGKGDEALEAANRWLKSEVPPPLGAYLLRSEVYDHMGRPDEAIADLRRELELDPTNDSVRTRIIGLYLDHHRAEEGLEVLRQAVQTPPGQARNWGNMARALRMVGDLNGALEAYEKALHFGGPHWLDRRFVELHMDMTRTMMRLEGDLPDILAGKKKPASARDALTLGKLLHLKREFAASTKLYQLAIAADPRLMDDRDLQFGYEAACSATLAVTPLSKDQPKDEGERAALRKQALDWMRAELVYYEKLAAGNYRDRTRVINVLRRWNEDADLAPIRGEALKLLPSPERVEFERFWADVGELVQKSY
jgi:serine/threonine-protein kinase